MQGIAHCFGGKIGVAHTPMHGKVSQIKHDELGVYKNIPQNIEVMRYHSLIAESDSLPDCLAVTSTIGEDSGPDADLQELISAGAEIMGLRHKDYPIEGIQFHPESFATEGGARLLSNFLTPQ